MNEALDDGIEARVLLVIAAAIECSVEDVTPNVPLLGGLGAESLDLLDIAFRLEAEFRIRMPRLNVMQRAEEHFGRDKLMRNGVLTDLGLEIVRATMPEADPDRIRPGLRAAELGTLLTAQTFVRVVRRMLEAKKKALAVCPHCPPQRGCTPVESSTTLEATGSLCATIIPFPAGDDVLLEDLMMASRP
jgi:acyl carrier protein